MDPRWIVTVLASIAAVAAVLAMVGPLFRLVGRRRLTASDRPREPMTSVVAGSRDPAIALGYASPGTADRSVNAGRWAVLLATVAGIVYGHRRLLGGWPTFASVEAVQRVTLAGGGTAAVAVVLAFRRVPAWTGLLLVLGAVAATMTWVASAYPLPPDVTRPAFWLTHAGTAVAVAVALFALVEPVAARSPGPAAAWVCGCLSAGLGLVELFTTVTQPGMVTASLGAVVGGTFLVAATGLGPRVDRGPVAVWVVLLVCLLAANRIGGGDPYPRPLAVLALAPVLAWVGEVGPIRRWRPWKRELLRGAVVALPVAVAVAMAVVKHNAEAVDNGGY